MPGMLVRCPPRCYLRAAPRRVRNSAPDRAPLARSGRYAGGVVEVRGKTGYSPVRIADHMRLYAAAFAFSRAVAPSRHSLPSDRSRWLDVCARYLHAMRLAEVRANELFSFEELALNDLPHRALVVVGPNGAGKTNLSRLVEIVLAAVERSATFSNESYARLLQFASGRRLEADPGCLAGVQLGIACTETWETNLILHQGVSWERGPPACWLPQPGVSPISEPHQLFVRDP
jgi:hypothetical protein